jgi:hypothetical protein
MCRGFNYDSFLTLAVFSQDEKFQDKKYKFLGKISFGLIKRPEED